jgi:hypothetical protein
MPGSPWLEWRIQICVLKTIPREEEIPKDEETFPRISIISRLIRRFLKYILFVYIKLEKFLYHTKKHMVLHINSNKTEPLHLRPYNT